MSTDKERSASAGASISKAKIREDILQSFPELFGTKTINCAHAEMAKKIDGVKEYEQSNGFHGHSC